MKKKITIVLVAALLLIATISLVACAKSNIATKYDVVKTTKMNNFELLNQTAKKDQVVMIGDSIVELYPTYELFADKDKVVYNRGISGDTSDRMLERLEKNALNINPSVLSVLVGTNDISRGISHEDILGNISKVIDKAMANGVKKIIIQSLYPVNYSINTAMVGGRKNKEIIELNGKIKALCTQKQVIYANVFDALKDKDGNFNKDYTYDGLHPNARGYVEINKVLEPIIFG